MSSRRCRSRAESSIRSTPGGEPRAAAAGLRLQRRLWALSEADVLPGPAAARRRARRIHDPDFFLRVRARAGRAAGDAAGAHDLSAPGVGTPLPVGEDRGVAVAQAGQRHGARAGKLRFHRRHRSGAAAHGRQRDGNHDPARGRRGHGRRVARRGVGRNGAVGGAHPPRADRARGARPRSPIASRPCRVCSNAPTCRRCISISPPSMPRAASCSRRRWRPTSIFCATAPLDRLWQVVREGEERWLATARELLALGPAARETAIDALLEDASARSRGSVR